MKKIKSVIPERKEFEYKVNTTTLAVFGNFGLPELRRTNQKANFLYQTIPELWKYLKTPVLKRSNLYLQRYMISNIGIYEIFSTFWKV